MIRVELDQTDLVSGEACSGRACIRLKNPTRAKHILITLSATQTIRRPFSGQAPVRHILYGDTHEVATDGMLDDDVIDFEVTVPHAGDLDRFPEPPAFLRRLVQWVAPDTIGPVQWEVQVRVERQWKRDLIGTAEVYIDLQGEQRRAS